MVSGKEQEISFTVRIFKENNVFVAHVPELDLSSCGDTEDDARQNIQDAVRGFLETAEQTGTLKEVLEEDGFHREGDSWLAPQVVSTDHVRLQFK